MQNIYGTGVEDTDDPSPDDREDEDSTMPQRSPLMGRPSLDLKPLLVRLLPKDMKRLKKHVPPMGASKFVRDLISRELDRLDAGGRRAKATKKKRPR